MSPRRDDEAFATWVETELRRELDAGPVDVTGLATRTSRGVRRARVRRRVTAGVAVPALLVAGLAVATRLPGTLRSGPADPSVAVSLASPTVTASASPSSPPPAPSPTGSPEPSPTAIPTPSTTAPTPTASSPSAVFTVPRSNDPKVVAYRIPDAVSIPADQLPSAVTQQGDIGQYRWISQVDGQDCDDGSHPLSIAGRNWSWFNPAASRKDVAVDLSVTGYTTGTGRARFAELAANTGACRFTDPVKPQAMSVSGVDNAWAATRTFGTAEFGHAAVLVGDVIIGVTVQSPQGGQAAVELAEKLVLEAAQRAIAAMPAAR